MLNKNRPRVEVITGLVGHRYWPAHEKMHIVKESLMPGESVSIVARRNGVAPNLLFRWRRLMAEGGADWIVTANVRDLGRGELRFDHLAAGAAGGFLDRYGNKETER